MRVVRVLVFAVVLIVCAGLTGCSGMPDGVTAVKDFELDRYLGQWYEIARLDHSFERGLSHVTANYSLREDGRIDVVNRGYDEAKGQWRTASGIARSAGEPAVGSLKVSFFRPFWADYHIVVLDRDAYAYAMVTSSSRKYLWILSRTPTLPADVLGDLVAQAREWGYSVDELIYVEQGERGN